MNYILLLAMLVVFVMGTKRTASLVFSLKDVSQRRNLLFRVAGFLAMSSWLHALPTLLMVIYMRQEGILASELLGDDDARTTLVGVYAFPQLLIVIFAGCLGVLDSKISEKTWKPNSRASLLAYLLAALVALALATQFEFVLNESTIVRTVFLTYLAAPIIFYLSFSFTTPLEEQIKFYWIPFATIAVVTTLCFALAEVTHDLVRDELLRFRSGGSNLVVVAPNGERSDALLGELVLLTSRTAYLRAVSPKWKSNCIVRVPTENASVATLRGATSFNTAAFESTSLPPSRSTEESKRLMRNLHARCGTLSEVGRPPEITNELVELPDLPQRSDFEGNESGWGSDEKPRRSDPNPKGSAKKR